MSNLTKQEIKDFAEETGTNLTDVPMNMIIKLSQPYKKQYPRVYDDQEKYRWCVKVDVTMAFLDEHGINHINSNKRKSVEVEIMDKFDINKIISTALKSKTI